MQTLTKIGIALLTAVVGGMVVGALSRALMRVVTYISGGEPGFSWSGTFFILLIHAIVAVPVAVVAAFTTRWWRWTLGVAGAAVLFLPAVSIASEEVGETSNWTTAQWVLGMTVTVTIFATIVALPIAVVRTIDLMLTRTNLRSPRRGLTIAADLATSNVA
jgi:hypothetical protein